MRKLPDRRISQRALGVRHHEQFARDAGRLNSRGGGDSAGAPRGHLSTLAASYRIGRLYSRV